MPHFRTLITCCLIPFFAGCSLEWMPFVYHLDIHQGNVVSQEMVDQLRPGITKRQAVYIMGEPLGKDPFHDDRWNYIYSNQPGGEPRVQKNITLVFKGDELTGLQGDYRPGNLPSIEMRKDTTITVPEIERELTLWQKIKSIFGADED